MPTVYKTKMKKNCPKLDDLLDKLCSSIMSQNNRESDQNSRETFFKLAF